MTHTRELEMYIVFADHIEPSFLTNATRLSDASLKGSLSSWSELKPSLLMKVSLVEKYVKHNGQKPNH